MIILNLQGSKPWRFTGKEENMDRTDIKLLVKKWWDIYEDESLDYKNFIVPATTNSEKIGSLFVTSLSEDGVVVQQRNAPSAA